MTDDRERVAALLRESAWCELHPSPAVRAARRRLLEARDELTAAGFALERAQLELAMAEAEHEMHRAGAALLHRADMSKPQ